MLVGAEGERFGGVHLDDALLRLLRRGALLLLLLLLLPLPLPLPLRRLLVRRLQRRHWAAARAAARRSGAAVGDLDRQQQRRAGSPARARLRLRDGAAVRRHEVQLHGAHHLAQPVVARLPCHGVAENNRTTSEAKSYA